MGGPIKGHHDEISAPIEAWKLVSLYSLKIQLKK